jgi:hypothetical protein
MEIVEAYRTIPKVSGGIPFRVVVVAKPFNSVLQFAVV